MVFDVRVARRHPTGARPANDKPKATAMTELVIHFDDACDTDACALCGGKTGGGHGPRLFRVGSRQAVCRSCGRKHAPGLAALVDLAHTAERVGRVSRHTVVPPLTSLLDLARAAEDYTTATPGRRRRAAAA